MKHMVLTSNKMKAKILNLLYEDELLNVFLIQAIENANEEDEIYINKVEEGISSILHIKFDGNSYFTSFYYKDEQGLNSIINELKNIKHNKLLISGKLIDVSKIVTSISKKEISSSDIYYKFNIELRNKNENYNNTTFRKARNNKEDINIIKKYLVDFFDAKLEEDIKEITNEERINKKLDTIYFIEYIGQVIGMAIICGETRNYCDITGVYIEPSYRGQGFGKILINYIINEVTNKNKIPVLQTSSDNIVARRVYEDLGFEKVVDYAFEFL